MRIRAIFSEELKERLRRPLGKLIPGTPAETSRILAERLRNVSGKIIAVGDRVSHELAALGVNTDVYVVDDKIERREVEPFTIPGALVMTCENKPGTISDEAYTTLKTAIDTSGPVIVRVKGEEDLLALVAIIEAPLGSLVIYGQPSMGVVIVEVDEETKRYALSILTAASS